MEQGALPFDAVSVDPALVCAFGEPWLGAHPLCEQEGDRLCRLFEAAVGRGEFDAHGYTPNERKAQARRLALSQKKQA